MKKTALILLAAAMPLAANELPPTIAIGPIHYDSVSAAPASPAAPEAPALSEPLPADAASAAPAPAVYAAPVSAPITPTGGSGFNGFINLNVYASNYQVRGMGVTNRLSHCGYSSLSGSYMLPQQNLFNLGIYQRVAGEFGCIWDAADELGDTPLLQLHYAMGKEIFPNLRAELGYSLHHGGLEGYMRRADRPSAHRLTQDFNLQLCFNDQQKGFFGHALWGWGFQGLTGSYFDFELGYRLTDLFSFGNFGSDLELSAGVAPSLGYWGAGVEGVDAYRLRACFAPFSHNGGFGRDARFYAKPWVQASWSGSNASKIDRCTATGPVDHFQLTFGVDLGYKF